MDSNEKYPPDPSLSPEEVAAKQRELIATTFAGAGFRAAGEAAYRLQTDEYADAVTQWTLMAIRYARPFKRHGVGPISEDFQTFPDAELEAHHNLLVTARDKEEAHTDIRPTQSVWVFPKGAFGDVGSATTARIPYAAETLPPIQRLCRLQAERATEVMHRLVDELYGYQEWPDGTMFQLDHPDDPRSAG